VLDSEDVRAKNLYAEMSASAGVGRPEKLELCLRLCLSLNRMLMEVVVMVDSVEIL
jgi:hypothetical protein